MFQPADGYIIVRYQRSTEQTEDVAYGTIGKVIGADERLGSNARYRKGDTIITGSNVGIKIPNTVDDYIIAESDVLAWTV